MGDTEKTIDSLFGKIQKEANSKIANFVAFFFFMIAIGAFIGMMVVQHYPGQALLAVIFPALAGAIAYYNRVYATAIFGLLMIVIFIL